MSNHDRAINIYDRRKIKEPFRTIGRRVLQRDTGFFEEHPDNPCYLRPYVPGELSPAMAADLGVSLPGQESWVIVCRTPSSDQRARLFIDDETANELIARSSDGRVQVTSSWGATIDIMIAGWEQDKPSEEGQ